MLLALILISFLVYLFVLYKLSREDYVFIRKNITPEQIFNYAFLSGLSGFIFSHVIFVLSNTKLQGINLLDLVLFLKFPGLSLTGGIVGGLIFMILLSTNRKIPLGRLLDIFSLSILCTLPIGIILHAFIQSSNKLFFEFLIALIYIAFAIFFIRFLYPMLIRGALNEGIICKLFLVSYSCISLFTVIAEKRNTIFTNFSLEHIILVVILFISLGFFIFNDLFTRSVRGGKK